MGWYAFFILCFTGHCAEVNWKEDFKTLPDCNETLPFIYAEVVNSGLVVKEIDCKKKGELNVTGKQASGRRYPLP